MKKKVLYILPALLLLAWQNARCQFNDSTKHYIGLNTTGSINRTSEGNSYLLNNGVKYNVRKRHFSSDFINTWIYGYQNNSPTNNDFSTALTFDWYKTFPHFFYWGLVTYNTSYSLKINNQLETGAGIAYNIIDNKDPKKNFLQLSDGVLYDQSDLMLANGVRDVYHTYRNSVRLSYRFTYKGRLVFEGAHYLQNSFDRGGDYIIRSNSNLSFKIEKWLAFTAALIYNRQNRTETYNLLFTYGITLEKYF